MYDKATKLSSNSFIMFYAQSEEKKVGFTATKKLGNAVIRNKSKRMLRALFVELREEFKAGVYVFVAKEGMYQKELNELKKDLRYVLKKLELTRK